MGALTIGVAPGRSFFLNDIEVTVDRIHRPSRVSLIVHSALDKKITITTKQGALLLPEWMPKVTATLAPDSGPYVAKIAIEAPPNVKILRDNLYHGWPKGYDPLEAS